MEQTKVEKTIMGNTVVAVLLFFAGAWHLLSINWTAEAIAVVFKMIQGGAFIFGGILVKAWLDRTKAGQRLTSYLKKEKKETDDSDAIQ